LAEGGREGCADGSRADDAEHLAPWHRFAISAVEEAA
jgi:hypothetical protein